MKKYSKEQLVSAVAESFSIAQVLRKLGLIAAGGNYKGVKEAIAKEGLDTSHFTGKGHLRGKRNPWVRSIDLDSILVENSHYGSNKLRKRLISSGIFQHQCSSCKLDEWMGKPIPLELEHINGINTDNRLENLSLLCPNCHALTPTYRGKNKKVA